MREKNGRRLFWDGAEFACPTLLGSEIAFQEARKLLRRRGVRRRSERCEQFPHVWTRQRFLDAVVEARHDLLRRIARSPQADIAEHHEIRIAGLPHRRHSPENRRTSRAGRAQPLYLSTIDVTARPGNA